MKNLCNFGKRVVICASLTIAASTGCAWAQSAQVEIEQMARQLKALMEQLATEMGQLTTEDPSTADTQLEFMSPLQTDIKESTKQIIKQIEDVSALNQAIDAYKVQTLALIAEAEASNNNAIKLDIAGLQETLDGLEAVDRKRSAMVVKALNLLRTLVENDVKLMSFMMLEHLELAMQLISADLEEFYSILEDGTVLAESLLDGPAQ